MWWLCVKMSLSNNLHPNQNLVQLAPIHSPTYYSLSCILIRIYDYGDIVLQNILIYNMSQSVSLTQYMVLCVCMSACLYICGPG